MFLSLFSVWKFPGEAEGFLAPEITEIFYEKQHPWADWLGPIVVGPIGNPKPGCLVFLGTAKL